MSRRALGVVAVALVLAVTGVLNGAMVRLLTRADSTNAGVAAPVPARGPALPAVGSTEPLAPYAEDIPYAPLQAPTSFDSYQIDNDDQTWRYVVPAGWVPTDVYDAPIPMAELGGVDEARFRPPGEPFVGGYSLRVKAVLERRSPSDMLDGKLEDLGVDPGVEDLTVLEQTADALYFTYRSDDNKLRYNFWRWFAAPGSDEATLEMSVVGREVDEPSLRTLLDRCADDLTPID